MQLCLEGWDQALSLFLLANLQSCQVLSLQMSRGEPLPQRSLLSPPRGVCCRAVVGQGTLGHHLLTYVFMPSPSAAPLRGCGAQSLGSRLVLACSSQTGLLHLPAPRALSRVGNEGR